VLDFLRFGATPVTIEPNKSPIQEDYTYTKNADDTMLLLASQVVRDIDNDCIDVISKVNAIGHQMQQSNRKVLDYDNLRFTIDFLGFINVEYIK
tara:strand:+ start:192 stop:473 length:282 start_codon:yes stop_codon:yes gene_type:complete